MSWAAVAVEPLAVQIADARREPQAEEVVGAEDHLGVAVRVGRVLLDRQTVWLSRIPSSVCVASRTVAVTTLLANWLYWSEVHE